MFYVIFAVGALDDVQRFPFALSFEKAAARVAKYEAMGYAHASMYPVR